MNLSDRSIWMTVTTIKDTVQNQSSEGHNSRVWSMIFFVLKKKKRFLKFKSGSCYPASKAVHKIYLLEDKV